jgi:hypothetical protein
MRLRSIALLLALLPGLMAPVGMTWCTALCTALSAAPAKSEHSCCERERAPAPPAGPQFAAACRACAIASTPRSELTRLEAAASAVALLAPEAAPQLQHASDAPARSVRLAFTPPSTAGPGGAPLPLRI